MLKPPLITKFELQCLPLGRASRYILAQVDLVPDVPVHGRGVRLGGFEEVRLLPVLFLFLILNASLKLNVIL